MSPHKYVHVRVPRTFNVTSNGKKDFVAVIKWRILRWEIMPDYPFDAIKRGLWNRGRLEKSKLENTEMWCQKQRREWSFEDAKSGHKKLENIKEMGGFSLQNLQKESAQPTH